VYKLLLLLLLLMMMDERSLEGERGTRTLLDNQYSTTPIARSAMTSPPRTTDHNADPLDTLRSTV